MLKASSISLKEQGIRFWSQYHKVERIPARWGVSRCVWLTSGGRITGWGSLKMTSETLQNTSRFIRHYHRNIGSQIMAECVRKRVFW
jgi:hypothetical protein